MFSIKETPFPFTVCARITLGLPLPACAAARLQAAEIIFNRAMGRPETYLKVDNAEQSVQASVARLQALFSADDDEEESPDAEKDESDPAEDPEENACAEEVSADAG